MAFKENRLSVPAAPSSFLGSGAEPMSSRVRDFIDGPKGERDTSEGSSYQQWRAYIQDGRVWYEADNKPKSILIDAPIGSVTDISIAFNQNADLYYAYVESGVAKFYWYDTLTNSYQTMVLPAGTVTPKITLDDKRADQTGRSDIILSYINPAKELCFRLQRERFGVERVLDPGPFESIERMYMNTGYRLQWSVTRS